MKRSEFLEQLEEKLIDKWGYDMNLTPAQLYTIIKLCEDLGMLPPAWMKPIPFHDGKQYPLVPGDFKNDEGIWCTPGYHGWEDER